MQSSTAAPTPVDQLLTSRRRVFGSSLRLSYSDPIHIVRGEMQYLYDASGRKYLDAYNNVPHVGHCHPRVVRVGQQQMAMLNSNTRYLNEVTNEYAERLIATFPPPLQVCYFVNSGSEANELALRLARAYTRRQDVIVLDHAYHGNTNTMIDISPYKHNGPGGQGAPPWVHTMPLPDLYRGPFRQADANAGEKYGLEVSTTLEKLRIANRLPAAFIAESWPSVAGQMSLPKEYLSHAYAAVRAAGGVCIADEIQTGYGRLGHFFWGFAAYDVVPDIVALGKPIGNGHPIGAVVTSAEIAASFDNGMEFFSTFGGNTVSCAIGQEVLRVVAEEGLQAHAQRTGDYLLQRLQSLMGRHAILGNVRGSGLFLGVELVRDRGTLEPAPQEAAWVVNRMKDQGVLVGTDGIYENVLKIRPPMPFDNRDADLLVDVLDATLAELPDQLPASA